MIFQSKNQPKTKKNKIQNQWLIKPKINSNTPIKNLTFNGKHATQHHLTTTTTTTTTHYNTCYSNHKINPKTKENQMQNQWEIKPKLNPKQKLKIKPSKENPTTKNPKSNLQVTAHQPKPKPKPKSLPCMP